MKKHAIILISIMAFTLPTVAVAGYENEISVGLASGSGDYDELGTSADVSTGTFFLGYARYFKPIETNDQPNGERVFLQHPSLLGAYLLGYSQEIKYSGAKLENTESDFGFFGKHYLASNTGLGLKIVAVSGEEKLSGTLADYKDELDGNMITLSVDQYVNENVNIAVNYELLNLDSKDDGGIKTEISSKVMEIEARALINKNFVLGAMIGSGDQEYEWPGNKAELDVARFGLELGFYPSQQLGLFLRMNSQAFDMTGYERTHAETSLSADYYFNEQTHLEVALASSKEDVDDVGIVNDYEITESGLSLLFGYLY